MTIEYNEGNARDDFSTIINQSASELCRGSVVYLFSQDQVDLVKKIVAEKYGIDVSCVKKDYYWELRKIKGKKSDDNG